MRAALNLKGIAYEERVIDLGKGEHHQPAYRALNPQGALPLLDHDGLRLTWPKAQVN